MERGRERLVVAGVKCALEVCGMAQSLGREPETEGAELRLVSCFRYGGGLLKRN